MSHEHTGGRFPGELNVERFAEPTPAIIEAFNTLFERLKNLHEPTVTIRENALTLYLRAPDDSGYYVDGSAESMIRSLVLSLADTSQQLA